MTSFFRHLLCRFLAATVPAALAMAQQPSAERPNGVYATVETSMGSFTFELFEKDAPATVTNFIDLALGRVAYPDPRNGLPSMLPLYSGLTFHRVIPEFMIQGGDPLGDGTGGTRTIPDEIKPELKFDRPGRVGMANAGPNSGSCQFFVAVAEQPHLDGLHTIFGQVVEGMDIVRKITGVPLQNDRPIEPVTIKGVKIVRAGPGTDPNAFQGYAPKPMPDPPPSAAAPQPGALPAAARPRPLPRAKPVVTVPRKAAPAKK